MSKSTKGMVLSTKDFALEYAKVRGCSANQGVEEVTQMLDCMSDLLMNNNSLNFRGYFSLTPSTRGEREGRNPATGESMIIPAKRTIKFKLAANLKKILNQE